LIEALKLLGSRIYFE